MYTMDFRFRQGSVEGLQFHPDPDALAPLPDLFSRVEVEYGGLLDLWGNLPDHRKDVTHRHPDREDARYVPENRRKLRQRRVSPGRWRRGGRRQQADLGVEDGPRELVRSEQLLADRPEPGDHLPVSQDIRRLPFLEKRTEARRDNVNRRCAKVQQKR